VVPSSEELEEGTRSRVPRGQAQERLHDACARLLAGVTLDDLTAFVTVARLTQESGVSSGAIYSAVDGGVGRSAPQQLARDAFLSVSHEDDEMVLDILEIIHSSIETGADRTATFIETIAALATDPVVESARSPERGDYTHFWLAAAVALNDPEVADRVGALLRGTVSSYERVIGRVLELSGRVLVDGIDLSTLAQMLTAAGDGAAIVLRLDPMAEPDLVRRMFLAVFIAVTRSVDDSDDLFATRLVGGRNPLSLSLSQLEVVRDTVLAIFEREGWAAVTLARVGGLAGLSESDLVSVYPTRHHLAAIAWDEVMAAIGRRSAGRSGRAAVDVLGDLVADLAEAACSRRSLVASLLAARLHDSTRADLSDPEPVDDPAVDLLASVIGDDGGLRRVAARIAVDALLMGAAVSESTPEEITAVMTTGLGALVDSPAGDGR